MNKKYRVTLTAAERQELDGLLARGKADVRRLKHAQILLKADQAEAGPAWPDARIAEALDAGITTVERVRQRFVEEGLASVLSPYRGGKRIYSRKLDGAQEAHLVALACSKPPEGVGAGRCGSSPGAWSSSPMWIAFRMRRCARRSKKRAQTAPEADVVHPREALGRVRLPHGGCAEGLSQTL
ncbi:MAG TPA: helix-turn-helix domain-containing protein [Herpetosiphonaceae bacterium]|nr:helix-turn-helix domain-containing protein [Herpetosiphonaceae bacterium]